MKPFRSVLTLNSDDSVCIKVIGYKQVFTEEVNSPSGLEDYFLFLLPRGSWCYLLGKKVVLTGDSLILQPPYTTIRHGREGGLVRSWIRFNGREIAALFLQNGIETGQIYEIGELSEHEEQLLALYRELYHPRGAISQNVINLFTNWLRSIRRDSGFLGNPPDRRLLLAREYMEQNFRQNPDIHQICAYAGLSRNCLYELFRNHYKISPKQYSISLRVSHAADLLCTSELTLERVAELSGFRDSYYFCRCFKSRTGFSPGVYRRRRLSFPGSQLGKA